MRLLLIEDDDDLRDEIREYLVRRRHAVSAFGSVAKAREALERISASNDKPDAVVCDINLRDGDGLDLYVAFASRFPTCKWVLMSGDPDQHRLATIRSTHPKLPPCLLVEKPVSLRELAKLLALA